MSVESSGSGLSSPSYEESNALIRGCYPFRSSLLPFELAKETNQKLMDFRKDIYGLIFSYPYGFDDDPFIRMPRLDPNLIRWLERADQSDPIVIGLLRIAAKPAQRFLHLFNVGDYVRVVSVTVEGVALKNIQIHPKKRISFILES